VAQTGARAKAKTKQRQNIDARTHVRVVIFMHNNMAFCCKNSDAAFQSSPIEVRKRKERQKKATKKQRVETRKRKERQKKSRPQKVRYRFRYVFKINDYIMPVSPNMS